MWVHVVSSTYKAMGHGYQISLSMAQQLWQLAVKRHKLLDILTILYLSLSYFCVLHRKHELYFREYFNPLCCHLLAYSLVLLIMWSINWITDRGVAIFRRKTIIFLPQNGSLNWFITFFLPQILFLKSLVEATYEVFFWSNFLVSSCQ